MAAFFFIHLKPQLIAVLAQATMIISTIKTHPLASYRSGILYKPAENPLSHGHTVLARHAKMDRVTIGNIYVRVELT